MNKVWAYITSSRDGLELITKRSTIEKIHNQPINKREFASRIEMPIRVKDRALIEKYKPRIQNSITVHARLGNGEQDMMESGPTDGKWLTPKRIDTQVARLSPDRDRFISEMKKHDTDFFICTDTLSFFEQCKDVFGDRVFCIERDWLPQGCGPGHNISCKPYSKDAKQQWRDSQLDPWSILCTDLTDMELMCESKHLIYNPSQFNYFARSAQTHVSVKK